MAKVMKSKNSILPQITAVALLVGTVIGAGILGLPYVFSQAGFWGGAVALVIIAAAATLMSLYFGELCLRTKEKHHLAGFAKHYLGKGWKYLVLAIETLGIYTILIAYLIAVGLVAEFLFKGSAVIWSTVFFVLIAPFIFINFQRTSRMELFITSAKVIILIALIFMLFPAANTSNLDKTLSLPVMFLPVGILIFSFMGYTAIPEIKETLLKKNPGSLWKVILASTIIAVAVYFAFNFVFVGTFGTAVAEIGTNSLTGNLVWIGALFVLLSLVTPFIALSTVIKNIYIKDFKIDRRFSWFLAAFIPYMIFLYGDFSFVSLIGFAGTFAFGLMSIITMIIVYKARKQKPEVKPAYVVPGGTPLLALTALVFAAAICYQLLLFVGFI